MAEEYFSWDNEEDQEATGGTQGGDSTALSVIEPDAAEPPQGSAPVETKEVVSYADMNRQLMQQNQMLIEMIQRNAKQDAPEPPKTVDPLDEYDMGTDDELTDEDKAILEGTPILAKIAKIEARRLLKDYDDKRVKEVVKRVKTTDEQTQTSLQAHSQLQMQTLLATVQSKLGGDFEAKKTHPGWEAFMQSEVPLIGGGIRYHDILDHKVKVGDADGIVAIYNAFNPTPPQAAPAKSRPSVSIPSGGVASGTPTMSSPKKPTTPADFDKKIEVFQRLSGLDDDQRKVVNSAIEDMWDGAFARHGIR